MPLNHHLVFQDILYQDILVEECGIHQRAYLDHHRLEELLWEILVLTNQTTLWEVAAEEHHLEQLVVLYKFRMNKTLLPVARTDNKLVVNHLQGIEIIEIAQ